MNDLNLDNTKNFFVANATNFCDSKEQINKEHEEADKRLRQQGQLFNQRLGNQENLSQMQNLDDSITNKKEYHHNFKELLEIAENYCRDKGIKSEYEKNLIIDRIKLILDEYKNYHGYIFLDKNIYSKTTTDRINSLIYDFFTDVNLFHPSEIEG